MRAIRICIHRLRSLFFPGRQRGELDREFALHLEQLTKELLAGGMSRREAEQEARRQFGPLEMSKEECRDMRRVGTVENLCRDVVYALRLLRKSLGFTITAVASLVLGIGANAAIYQLFDTVSPDPPFTIVGMAGDSKYRDLSEELTPIVYFADSQDRVPRTTVRFLLRTGGNAAALIPTVKRVLAETDPQLNMRFVVLRLQLAESVLRERLMATLSTAFGVLGMMLALTGVFGVTAYVVSRRHREFGVRQALGATAPDIVRLILGETIVVLGLGIVIGTSLSLAAGSSVSAVLYGVEPRDAGTLAVVIAMLAAGGLTAALIPALRAARVAPVEALRLE